MFSLRSLTALFLGGSPYVLILVAILSGVSAGTLAWTVRGWKAGSEIAIVQKSLDDYKLETLGDANAASHQALDEIQTSLRSLRQLQTQTQRIVQQQSTSSVNLLKELNQNATAKDPVCAADLEYLDGLRKLQSVIPTH